MGLYAAAKGSEWQSGNAACLRMYDQITGCEGMEHEIFTQLVHDLVVKHSTRGQHGHRALFAGLSNRFCAVLSFGDQAMC